MAINSKSTKAEILAAYKDIEKQKKILEAEVKKGISKNISSSTVASPNSTRNSTRRVVSSSNPSSVKDIAKTIEALEQIKSGFGGAVSNLSEQLIAEATKLESVRDNIALEKVELKELHNLDKIKDSTIDELIEQYQASAKKFAEELRQQQESDRQEIETLRQTWEKEKDNHNRFIKSRNEDYRKTQQREKEEYEYQLDLARDLDEEEYEHTKKQQQQELESHRQTLEKQWAEKEAGITKQEKEYAEAKEKVAAFEEELKSKIKRATEEGKGIGTYQAKIKADLRTREIEGESKNYDLRIESLENTIRHQNSRISKLSQQLDASLQQVQDLAVKAIEGSSNRNSFEAMKAIAMEQAKTQNKGK